MKPYYQDNSVTLYHADCLDVLPTLEPGSVDAVVTDPPYGMNWDTKTSRFGGGSMASRARRGIGKIREQPVIGDDQPFDPSPWLIFPHVILWGQNHFADKLPSGSALVWIKRNDDAFGSFLSDAEIAWKKGGCGVYCRRDLSMTALALRREHPTQKPVGIMAWCLSFVPESATILDPFAGSGTTGVAAKELGRKAILIEMEERYCEIAANRLRNCNPLPFPEATPEPEQLTLAM